MSLCQSECHRFESDIPLQQDGDIMTEEKQPSTFKQEWEAKKLLKRSKKKAKKSLIDQGHSEKEATRMIKQAMKIIS